MLAGLTGTHLIVVVAAIVLLFGATKLPIFAKGLGSSIKILRTELRPEAQREPVPADAAPTTTA